MVSDDLWILHKKLLGIAHCHGIYVIEIETDVHL